MLGMLVLPLAVLHKSDLMMAAGFGIADYMQAADLKVAGSDNFDLLLLVVFDKAGSLFVVDMLD